MCRRRSVGVNVVKIRDVGVGMLDGLVAVPVDVASRWSGMCVVVVVVTVVVAVFVFMLDRQVAMDVVMRSA